MSERLTRKDVDTAFAYFCERGGFRQAGAWNDVGGLHLDYAPVYGGFVIERVSNASGGVSRPFGDRRRSLTVMFETLHFAADSFREAESVQRRRMLA